MDIPFCEFGLSADISGRTVVLKDGTVCENITGKGAAPLGSFIGKKIFSDTGGFFFREDIQSIRVDSRREQELSACKSILATIATGLTALVADNEELTAREEQHIDSMIDTVLGPLILQLKKRKNPPPPAGPVTKKPKTTTNSDELVSGC